MYTLDDLSVYIFNWKKVTTNSIQLYFNIKKIINNVSIINCDENILLSSNIKHIQLDDSHYYGSQYEHAIKDTKTGSIFCVIVGDNIPNSNFQQIFNRAIEVFNTYNVGVYAPNDKRSVHKYINFEFKEELYDVDNTDCGFWFIHPNIVSKLKDIKYGTLSNFGWGIDKITIKEARRQKMNVLRDYSIETDQLDQTTNYDTDKAYEEKCNIEDEYNRMFS